MTVRTQRSTRNQRIRRGFLFAANAALLGTLGFMVHQKRNPPAQPMRAQIEMESARTSETRRAPIELRPSHAKQPTPRIPTQALSFSEIPKGNYCTMYARLVAAKLYGMKYEKGDAWVFAEHNQSVWEGKTTKVSDVAKQLHPGQIIGIYNPKSSYNTAGRKYTHTATYVGQQNGQHWVMQRIGTRDRLEPLEDFLVQNPGWQIREIIQPRK